MKASLAAVVAYLAAPSAVLGAAGFLFFAKKRRTQPAAGQRQTTEEDETTRRVKLVLPKGPSENVSALLGPRLGGMTIVTEPNDEPDPVMNWIVCVRWDRPKSATEIHAIVSDAWCDEVDLPEVMHQVATTGAWQYEVENAAITATKFAWSVVEEEDGILSRKKAERWWQAAADLAAAHHGQLHADRNASEAAAHAATLRKLRRAAENEKFAVVLAAPETGFSGKALWDALTSVGLEWGEQDRFHWTDADGESVFSVSTSTAPGYFLPEQAAKDNFTVTDLIFELDVAGCLEPERAWESMLRAAQYTQEKLGGRRIDAHGKPMLAEDENRLRNELRAVIQQLRDTGITPGTERAIEIFYA